MPEPGRPKKFYKMPDNIAQALLSFLAKQPYGEVFMLIAAIQQMPEVASGDEGVALGNMSPEEIKAHFDALQNGDEGEKSQ